MLLFPWCHYPGHRGLKRGLSGCWRKSSSNCALVIKPLYCQHMLHCTVCAGSRLTFTYPSSHSKSYGVDEGNRLENSTLRLPTGRGGYEVPCSSSLAFWNKETDQQCCASLQDKRSAEAGSCHREQRTHDLHGFLNSCFLKNSITTNLVSLVLLLMCLGLIL